VKAVKKLSCSRAWWLVLFLMMSPVASNAEQAKAPPAAEHVKAVDHEAESRSYFTDLELVTQDGETVRFFSDVLKDWVVLINFVFTHCEDACPMATQKLLKVSAMMGEEIGRSVRLVSISIDPERDSPAAMKKFAKTQGADQDGWLFLTGAPANVNQVVRKLGQYTSDVESHSTLILAGNVNKRHWVKVTPMMQPPIIMETLHRLMDEQG